MATSSSAQAFGWALPTSEQSYKKDKNDSPKPIANPLLKGASNYSNVTSFANGVQSPPQARAPFSQVDNTTLRRRKQSLESTKTIEPVFLPPKSSLLATGALYLELPETIIVSFKFFMDFFCIFVSNISSRILRLNACRNLRKIIRMLITALSRVGNGMIITFRDGLLYSAMPLAISSTRLFTVLNPLAESLVAEEFASLEVPIGSLFSTNRRFKQKRRSANKLAC